MEDEPSCFTDIRVLFEKGKLFDVGFFCDMNLSSARFWNRFFRFIILYTAVIGILNRDSPHLMFALFTVAGIYTVNCVQRRRSERMTSHDENESRFKINSGENSAESQKTCYRVNKQNPFGNPSVGFKNDIPTCKDQHKKSDELFFKNLPIDPLDPFRRQAQSRQFYTVSNTKDVNDQTEFANWLYN
jgi:hypothetical protein